MVSVLKENSQNFVFIAENKFAQMSTKEFEKGFNIFVNWKFLQTSNPFQVLYLQTETKKYFSSSFFLDLWELLT